MLQSLGLSVERVRDEVVQIAGYGAEHNAAGVPFTPRARKVLELALREALSVGENYIGSDHILLGLVREKNGWSIRALKGARSGIVVAVRLPRGPTGACTATGWSRRRRSARCPADPAAGIAAGQLGMAPAHVGRWDRDNSAPEKPREGPSGAWSWSSGNDRGEHDVVRECASRVMGLHLERQRPAGVAIALPHGVTERAPGGSAER